MIEFIIGAVVGVVAGAVPTFFITKNSPAHAATVNAAAQSIVTKVESALPSVVAAAVAKV